MPQTVLVPRLLHPSIQGFLSYVLCHRRQTLTDEYIQHLVSKNALPYRILQEILSMVEHPLREFRHYSKLILDVPKKINKWHYCFNAIFSSPDFRSAFNLTTCSQLCNTIKALFTKPIFSRTWIIEEETAQLSLGKRKKIGL